MFNKTKDTARKEESHAEVTDSQRRHALLMTLTVWQDSLKIIYTSWRKTQEGRRNLQKRFHMN